MLSRWCWISSVLLAAGCVSQPFTGTRAVTAQVVGVRLVDMSGTPLALPEPALRTEQADEDSSLGSSPSYSSSPRSPVKVSAWTALRLPDGRTVCIVLPADLELTPGDRLRLWSGSDDHPADMAQVLASLPGDQARGNVTHAMPDMSAGCSLRPVQAAHAWRD